MTFDINAILPIWCVHIRAVYIYNVFISIYIWRIYNIVFVSYVYSYMNRICIFMSVLTPHHIYTYFRSVALYVYNTIHIHKIGRFVLQSEEETVKKQFGIWSLFFVDTANTWSQLIPFYHIKLYVKYIHISNIYVSLSTMLS